MGRVKGDTRTIALMILPGIERDSTVCMVSNGDRLTSRDIKRT